LPAVSGGRAEDIPPCFKEQLDTPVLFNLSKDLLLFATDDAFIHFPKRSFNTFGTNGFIFPVDLRFLGICGLLHCEAGHYKTTYSRLYLFDRLEELILENFPEGIQNEAESPFVQYLKKTWTSRRAKAVKKLKGYVSEHDLELPKASFLSLKEIRRLANADPR
jgi:hypothetical protein